MAKINKLTDSFLKSIKCESDKKFIKFADPSLKGLYVFIYPSCRRKNKISIWKNKTSIKVEILFFYKP